LLAVFLAVTWPASAQDPTPRRYSLKQEQPDTGSHILRDAASGSRVQLDKPFRELPAAEQAFWKSQYEDLGPNDVPPFPARGLKTLYNAMSVVQRRHQVRGKVTMFVQIDKTGRATSVSVLASPDPLVTKDVAAILMLEDYTSAVCAGVPCAMDFPFRITFELR
jgi:hypothetical protein